MSCASEYIDIQSKENYESDISDYSDKDYIDGKRYLDSSDDDLYDMFCQTTVGYYNTKKKNESKSAKSCETEDKNMNENRNSVNYCGDIDIALDKFEQDLKGPDFMLCPEQAKYSKNMLKRFIGIGQMTTIGDLLDESNLRDSYAKLLKRGLKASTRNNYLRVIKDYFDTIAIGEEANVTKVSRLKVIIDRWIKNSKGDLRKDQYAHKLKCQENLITPEDMIAFENSKAVKLAKCYLKECHTREQHIWSSESEICGSRAYVSIRIATENGQRAGSISHMTLKEFENRLINEDNSARIFVLHHKTSETHGPSILSLSPELHNYVVQYINNVRPLLAVSENDASHVFLSETGSKMSSSQLSSAAKMFWKRATKTVKNFNFTIIRKSVTTNVRQLTKNDANTAVILANQMTHDKSTADKHYHLTKNSTEEHVQIHDTICKSMGLSVPYTNKIESWNGQSKLLGSFINKIDKEENGNTPSISKVNCFSITYVYLDIIWFLPYSP